MKIPTLSTTLAGAKSKATASFYTVFNSKADATATIVGLNEQKAVCQ